MTIRQGSKGTKDPAAANWDRVFGGGAARAEEPIDSPAPPAGALQAESAREGRFDGSPGHPSPTPAELDPSDGA